MSIGEGMKTFVTEFDNFTVRCRFSKKRKKFIKTFNVLWLHAATTPQWL